MTQTTKVVFVRESTENHDDYDRTLQERVNDCIYNHEAPTGKDGISKWELDSIEYDIDSHHFEGGLYAERVATLTFKRKDHAD